MSVYVAAVKISTVYSNCWQGINFGCNVVNFSELRESVLEKNVLKMSQNAVSQSVY